MTKIQYLDYLLTDHWQEFRDEYLAHNNECAHCGIGRHDSHFFYGQDLNVHHLHYRTLWNEGWDDVQALCIRCHEIEHFGQSAKINWAEALKAEPQYA